jgi:triphosphatase
VSDRRPPSADGSVPTETELKLALPAHAAAALSRHPLVRNLRRGRSRKSVLTSTYFDTNDGMLAMAGVALRLRRDGRRWLQTVKGRQTAASAGGLTARAEFEWPVAGANLDPLRFGTTPFRRLLGRAEQSGLHAQFTTEYTRTTIPLAMADHTKAQLCIDVGNVHSLDGLHRLEAPICEIELELESGDALHLYEFVHALAADVPLALEPRSKAERGQALRRPVAPAPVRAADAPLRDDAATGEAFAAIIRACLRQIEGNVHGVVEPGDPEWIHQMRIGVRRLRACLSLARRVMAPERIEPLRGELRWLAHALGPARDYDVFVLETLPLFTAAVARGSAAGSLQPALRALAKQAAARRAEGREAARAAVASGRFLRLVLAASMLAAAPGSSPTLAEPARDVARPLLKRRHRALLALGANLAHAAPENRHAARLAAKHLRYATEFFAPLYPVKSAREFRRALAQLQDEMGAWNDASVATQLATDLAGADSPAAAAFGGWAAAHANARSDTLEAVWAAFARARPFWSRG